MTDVRRPLEYIDCDKIGAFAKNARAHSKKQIDKLAGSMKERGVTNPLLIDEDNILLAGHGRLAAARKLKLKSLPCIRLTGMSEEQKRAYRLADNQLALEASWDVDLLSGELKFLVDCEFDIELTGFDQPDVDSILVDANDREQEPRINDDDVIAIEPSAEAITQAGDLWLLDGHRLLCGNARNGDEIGLLMDGQRAAMAFVDAPYNVPINGHVSGNGSVRHREFVEASGEMSSEEFVNFLTVTLKNLAQTCRNGAIIFSCIDWRHLPEMIKAGQAVIGEWKNLCVWNKTNAGMGSFYRSQHELVTVWKVGDAPHTNNFGLGERGRNRSNVWTYAGVNSFRAGRMDELALHPTVKPVAMVADAIRDVSHRGEVVLDIFGGSGTTLIAAEKTGRHARLLELDPLYCDVTIRRWEKQTGKQARLHGSNATFEDVAKERGNYSQEKAA